jgi:hypothetical protein
LRRGEWRAATPAQVKELRSVDVEGTLQELLDREQIKDTLYRYASTIDVKDFDQMRTLFTDDIVAQYGDAPPIEGADTLVKWIDQMTVDRPWQHHLLSVYHVDLDGDEADALVYHTSHQLAETDPDNVIVIVARYRNSLRRVGGAWKISRLKMEIGWLEERRYSQTAAGDKEAAENLAAQDRARN